MSLHIRFENGNCNRYEDVSKMEAQEIMRKLSRNYYLRLERVLSSGYIIIAIDRWQFGN